MERCATSHGDGDLVDHFKTPWIFRYVVSINMMINYNLEANRVLGHLTLSVIPMILFGSTSAVLYLLCAIFSPFIAIWNLAQPRKKVWVQDHPYNRLAVSA